MSRAREASHAYLVADSLDQAAEDLQREWSAERRMGWASDLGVPDINPQVYENDKLASLVYEGKRLANRAAGMPEADRAREAALSHARLSATYFGRTAAVPKNPALEIAAANGRLHELREQRRQLERGEGPWANTEAGRAARDVMEARREMGRAASMAEQARWRDRPSYKKRAAAWSEREAEALGRWAGYGAPEARSLDGLIAEGENSVGRLGKGRDRQQRNLDSFDRGRTKSRLGEFERDIYALRDRLDGIEPSSVVRDRGERSVHRVTGGLDHDHGLDYDHYRGISRDLGRGLGR
jgi:hypothetical protein